MGRTKLSADDWLEVLARLSDELPKGIRHVGIIGGGALALAYNARRTTGDLDVILPDDCAMEVISAADRIAAACDLEPGWMNQKARDAGYVDPRNLDLTQIVYSSSTFDLAVPPAEQLLALKLVIMHRSDDDTEDAKILLKRARLRHDDVESVWNRLGSHVLLAKRKDAYHNLLELWELANDAPT